MKWLIAAPAWGNHHVEMFRTVTLPFYLDALAFAGVDAEWLCHTDQPRAIFDALPGGKVTCLGVPGGDNRYAQFAAAHREAINMAGPGDRVLLLCVDMVISRETVWVCDHLFNGGARLVTAASLRTLAQPQPTPPMSSLQVNDWMLDHMHPYTLGKFWGEAAMPPSLFLWRSPQGDVTVRGLHLHPIAVLKDRPISFANTADADLVTNFKREEVHVITRGELACCELSPLDLPFSVSRQPFTPTSIVYWARRSSITRQNWWQAEQRIVLRGEGRTDDEAAWAEVVRLRDTLPPEPAPRKAFMARPGGNRWKIKRAAELA